MRRTLHIVVLALLGSVLFCAAAFAAAPPAKVTTEAEPSTLDTVKQIANRILPPDPATIEAKLRSGVDKYNASSQQVQPALGNNGAGPEGQAPAAPGGAPAYTGSKKVIYGDIILHK